MERKIKAKQESKHQSYFFKTFVIGMVAISSIAQPELVPLIIGMGVVNAAA